MLTLLPLVAFAAPAEPSAEPTGQAAALAADVELAGLLGGADTIDWIRGDRAAHTITFAIERAGEAYEVVATTGAKGVVEKVDVTDRGDVGDDPGDGPEAPAGARLGALGWLVEPMQETTSVARLLVDRDGAVTVVTGDGQRYMAIPGRGSGGNAAVEARWAAAWDRG